jgi:hypothetical protein
MDQSDITVLDGKAALNSRDKFLCDTIDTDTIGVEWAKEI